MADGVRIAGVVVLYGPNVQVCDAIAGYLDQIELLFAIDNSEAPDPAVALRLAGLPKVRYRPNNANLGIARALNQGAAGAIAAGCDFLLTMDQDSLAAPDMIERMLECLAGLDRGKVGMISPFHVTRAAKPGAGMAACEDVLTPMTSGCLLNLSVYRAVGPFRDDFFIDFVDNEYCLRLQARGFRVLRANRALLVHNVGDIRKYGPFIATNHSPLRRYYKTRNRFWVFREYLRDFPAHCLFDMVRLVKEIASIVLFEGEKLAKLRMMWRGYRDFRREKFGRYEEGV